MKPGHVKKVALLAGTLMLGGCTAGPEYVRPAVEIPAAYKEAGDWKVAQPRDTESRGKWWEIFGDPKLDALMARIDLSNQNVRIAEAQFRQARALTQSARAGFYPSVSGGASATRSRSPRAGGYETNYELSLDAKWEADLWGRVRRTVEAAEAGAQASAADLEALKLSTQAELAQAYFQLRILDAQRQLLDDTVRAFETSLELTKNRYAVGVAGKVDVVQAETQLKSTQAQAIDVAVQRAQLEHAIAVLIGRPPAEFGIPPEPLAVRMPAIPPELPSALLERRPDIAAAERRTAGANAQIGVAQAAFFPELTLSAVGGFQGSTLGNWLSLPNRFWSLGPALAQSLFDAGLRRALTDQAIAVYDANVASYRQTVLAAFQEVEDNLAALRILDDEARVQEAAVRAARESLVLTLNQYKAGTISYLNVVTVQTTQLNNERTAVGILGRQLTAAVLLVKALGGGWHVAALPSAASPAPHAER
ncbi:MAG TPA: efflux transporter outer membrane subunit [Burkholderiales bacterium]|nr:efflux transporter outer membrane subunit [Burkholderiales bacterium]